MRSRLPVLLLAPLSTTLLLGAASPAPAQVTMGPEFQVSEWTTDNQELPSVAADAAGEFVVAWQSYMQGNDGCYGYAGTGCFSVYARRYDDHGRPLDGEFQVNVSTASTQKQPAVARAPSGEFVVAWDNDVFYFGPGEIWSRRYDAEGNPLGGAVRANADFGSDESGADVATDGAGAFVVTWTHNDLSQGENGIYGRLFDADGSPLGPDVTVEGPDMPFTNGSSRVARADSGEFVVVWGKGTNIWGHRFDAAGLSQGASFGISACCLPSGAADVSMRGTGGFVVVWHQQVYGGDQEIFARRYDQAGVAEGAAFRTNSTTSGNQSQPAVAADAAGNFLVVWSSQGQDGDGAGIVGRRFDSAGQALGGEFQVNAWVTGDQERPAVAATPYGDFLVAWQSVGQDGSGRGVFGRLLRFPLFADGFESGDTGGWSSTQN